MLQSIILISLSILLMGASSCSSTQKIDAYQCIMVSVDQDGNKKPLEEWYWFCLNQFTQQQKTIWLKDSDKCIREDKPCKFYGTDIEEIERVKKWYKDNNQCPQ